MCDNNDLPDVGHGLVVLGVDPGGEQGVDETVVLGPQVHEQALAVISLVQALRLLVASE